MPAAAKKEKPRSVCYGVTAPKGFEKVFVHPVLCELFFFQHCQFLPEHIKAKYTGPGAYGHAVNAANMLWRQPGKEIFRWHPDLETALEEYCSVTAYGETLVTGPASGGKTFGAAIYVLLSVLCDPENTGALVCSTTLQGLKMRLWGDIRKLFLHIAQYAEFREFNLVDSLTHLQSDKGNPKRGILGVAVAEGNEAKAMGKIIGFHPPRLFVVVDELTDVSWAIIEALNNLFTAKKKAHFMGIANAASIFDSHGKMCEPEEGWNSITVESTRWKTKRGGTCIHFDGFRNPNVTSGKVIFDFLLQQKDIDETAKNYGENSPQMWRMRRGFWCPEGTVSTVLSEPLINNFMCMQKASWESTFTMFAGLDPAFEGGDRCVLRFGKSGKDAAGRSVLELCGIHVIKPDVSKFKERPLEYQIADQVIALCNKEGVTPEHFGMDVTGAGAGLAAIIAEEWKAPIHRVHFAESPSELPCGPTDSRPCNEVYKNKVTELWYYLRMVVMGYMLKGLDAETAVELCARRYEVKAKIVVESKSDMKSRPGAKSPDLADALAVLADTVKHSGGLIPAASKAMQSVNRQWEKMVRDWTPDDDDAYTEDSALAAG